MKLVTWGASFRWSFGPNSAWGSIGKYRDDDHREDAPHFNCMIINEFLRRQAEQEARRKALIAGMKDKKKRFEVRAYENDGWCKMLQIWRPKATVNAGFIKEKNVKSKWFRDPNTDQERFLP